MPNISRLISLPARPISSVLDNKGRGTNLGALTHPRNNSAQSWASRPQALALGCIGQGGTNMLACEAWEISKDLIFVHPTGEVLKNIAWGEAGSDKCRLPAAHAGGDLNQILPIHNGLRL
jgi:hypothetical protein